jgi:hypothetical protein
MAVTSLESLVLGGIRVALGVKTQLVREDSKAHVQTSASMSHPRHWSPSGSMADYQADLRHLFDEAAAIRAGRSVRFASVPVSCPAESAGRTIRARWSLAEGGPCATAVRRLGGFASTRTSAANGPLGQISRNQADQGVKPPSKPASKPGKATLAWPMPADAMPSASTRGR